MTDTTWVKPFYDDLSERCPQCGGNLQHGYGLAGGGIGAYRYCSNDACDYTLPSCRIRTRRDSWMSKERFGDTLGGCFLLCCLGMSFIIAALAFAEYLSK